MKVKYIKTQTVETDKDKQMKLSFSGSLNGLVYNLSIQGDAQCMQDFMKENNLSSYGEILELELKNLLRFRLLETGISEVYWMSKFGNWRLKYWNDVLHQPKELVEGENKY